MTKITGFIKEHIVTIGLILAVLLLAYNNYLQKQAISKVTFSSQEQAETAAGVHQAAADADVKLDAEQEKEVATVIKEIRTTEQVPVYIVQATGANLNEATESARKRAEADFSIVTRDTTSTDTTDKILPSEASQTAEAITDNTPVTLNQYNIQAYKKHINTIEYQPWEKAIGYTHQWKVSKNGRYIGVGADYDIDDKRVYAKVVYSW